MRQDQLKENNAIKGNLLEH